MSTTEVGQSVVNYILIFSYTAPFLNFFFFYDNLFLSKLERLGECVCIYARSFM